MIKMNKKLILLMSVMFLLVALPLISAESSYTFKQSETINQSFICYDENNSICSSANTGVINIYAPNGTTLVSNDTMTYYGTDWRYTLPTDSLGTYSVLFSFIGESTGTGEFTYEVTPSGNSGNDNIVFFLFVILLLYGITFFGFFGKNIPITILGGMALLFLGVYLIQQGIIIYRDNLTNYIAYLTLFTGVITTFWAILEQLDVI